MTDRSRCLVSAYGHLLAVLVGSTYPAFVSQHPFVVRAAMHVLGVTWYRTMCRAVLVLQS